MKEMKYQTTRLQKGEILAEGEYKDHKYVILNLGTHPTAYVALNKDIENRDSINVHGGITYNGPALWGEGGKEYIGWDYAHFGDYYGADELMSKYGICYSENKRWTTEEIFEEVKSVIKQLIDIEKKEATDE